MERVFGEATADGEKFLAFSKIRKGEQFNPESEQVEKYIVFSDFEQLILDSRVSQMEVQAGNLPGNKR
jgi:hypothetical protein